MTGCGGPGAIPILGFASPAHATAIAAKPPTAATINLTVHFRRSKVMRNLFEEFSKPAPLARNCSDGCKTASSYINKRDAARRIGPSFSSVLPQGGEHAEAAA